jgi:hypothetical protein
MTGKQFEKILLARILTEVSGQGLLRNEHFGFRPKHSTELQLARLIESVSRNLEEKRPISAVFLDVAKSFDSAWVDGLLYKLTVLIFPIVPCEKHLFLCAWSDVRSVLPTVNPLVACGLAWFWME